MKHLTLYFISLLCFPSLLAQPPELRVGYSELPPFAFVEDGVATGFSIELWEAVSRETGLAYKLVLCDGVADKLEKLSLGEIDMAIGGITNTAEREKTFDFSYPTFRTGLDILIRNDRETSALGWVDAIFTRNKLFIIGGFLLLIVVSGHLIWFAERGADAFSDNYFPGVFEGMYWAIVTASTVGYGDKAPVKWLGRALAGFVIVVSLPLFAIFTAEIASSFAVQELRGKINGPRELGRVRVATISGSTSAEYAVSANLDAKYLANMSEAIAALEAGSVDAVVYDAPSLAYYAKHGGAGNVHVIGKIFHQQSIGFAISQSSDLRKKLNLAILELESRGELRRIRSKWFGN